MARKPMVTRTINTTTAKVLCLNIQTGESYEKEVTLPRTYKKDAEVLSLAREIIDNEIEKAVHVISTVVIEIRYGMTEQEFIEHAQILPALTKEEKEAETEN